MGAIKILIVVTSHEHMGDTARKTGVWLEELAVPYYIFKDAGASVTLASPKGGEVPLDPKSESIIVSTSIIRKFQKDPEAIALLEHSRLLAAQRAEDFDLVFLPGGHGPMWDFPGNAALKQLLENFHRQHKLIGAVCHGVAALLSPENGVGDPILKGRQVTGFSNSEEEVSGLSGTVPFLLETALVALGASYSKGPDFESRVVTDGNIITGQNPSSAKEVARKLLVSFALLPKKIEATMN